MALLLVTLNSVNRIQGDTNDLFFNHNIPGRLPTTSRGCPQPQIAPCQNPCGFKSRANHNPTTAKTFEPVHLSVQRRRPQRISGGAPLAITNTFRIIVRRRKHGRALRTWLLGGGNAESNFFMLLCDSAVGPTLPKITPGVLYPHAEGASAHAEIGSLKNISREL